MLGIKDPFVLLLLGLMVQPGLAQSPAEAAGPSGFTFAGIPNLNYDSDEGIGYGARASLYNHAEGGYSPYFYTVEANVFLTSRGRKQFFLFFDSPHLLGPKQRLTGEIRYEKFDPAPFYGLGNDTPYDEDLIDEESAAFVNEDYYGFKRARFTVWTTYQRRFGPFKVLGGLGLVHSEIALSDGPTLLQTDEAVTGKAGGFTNYVKVGLIYDTRDFEPAPSRGDWTDVIVEVSDERWGSDYDYARLTLTNRHYVSLA
ncbi:MAG: BamA/TamA family outer membrane protein, partial [Bacteroidetes bacterium]|nr:BamA/TamA family outer membrane protein [Bacteroidota bacterium]